MELDELDDLYHDVILDHRRNPRNHARPDDANLTADGVNPFCGDEIHLQIGLDGDDRISRIGLQAVGCSINQATGSMLTEALKGKTLDDAVALSDAFAKAMRASEEPTSDGTSLGDLGTLYSVRRFPVRIKCALLAWDTFDDGIAEWRQSRRG